MSLEDEIREVPMKEFERDWQNRVDYFKNEYALAMNNYISYTGDKNNPNLEVKTYYDPGTEMYLYEVVSRDEEFSSELQRRIDDELGL